MEKINIASYKKIIILTGAGISKSSGINTFRGENGIWLDEESKKFSKIETLESHIEDTLNFFNKMKTEISLANPNVSHKFLSERFSNALIITQNIDELHQKAGSLNVVELHGSLFKSKCTKCDYKVKTDFMKLCPCCGNHLRPDIVLFGEYLGVKEEHESKIALRDCDLFISIGTSGTVYPASGFVRGAKYSGARTIHINTEKTENENFDEQYIGKSDEILEELFS